MLPSDSMTSGRRQLLSGLPTNAGKLSSMPSPGWSGMRMWPSSRTSGSRTRSRAGPRWSGWYSRIRKFGVDAAKWTATAVETGPSGLCGRDGHVMGFGHRRDFLGLEETTADQDVRLKDVGRAGCQNVSKGVLGVEHFSRRDRDTNLPAQGGEGRDILGTERLLDEEGAKGLHRLGNLTGLVGLEDPGVRVEANVDRVADRLPHCLHSPGCSDHDRPPGHLLTVRRLRSHLDARETLVDRLAG